MRDTSTNEILTREPLTPVTKLFEVYAPAVARKARAGQFVIVRVDERGERVPMTVADYDRQRGTVTIVVQEVGKTTIQMGEMEVGDCFATLAGPLGRPSEIKKCSTVICVGGGSSIAAIYPLARELKAAGSVVLSIIGARTKELIFWEKKIGAVSDELIICTDDGSYGREALVTAPLKEMLESGRGIDHVYAIGPAVMMKFCCATTRPYGVATTVSVNSIMVDGTGMCGACRVKVGGEVRFACVDGPKFDGHEVDWDNLLARQRFYLEEERESMRRWKESQHECPAA